jgi:hypothetical protein
MLFCQYYPKFLSSYFPRGGGGGDDDDDDAHTHTQVYNQNSFGMTKVNKFQITLHTLL